MLLVVSDHRREDRIIDFSWEQYYTNRTLYWQRDTKTAWCQRQMKEMYGGGEIILPNKVEHVMQSRPCNINSERK